MAFDSGVFLPTELWHLVSIYLQPEDLLSLGQACRVLRLIINNKDVWDLAAVRLGRTWGVPPPPCNLTLHQLQRWALSPHRWDQLIAAHRRPASAPRVPLVPKSTVLLDSALQSAHRGCTITGLELINGGRFLASFAWDSCTLALWNLGQVGLAPQARPRLAASLDLDGFPLQWLTAAWTVVDNSIRCALSSPLEHLEGRVRIYEIDISHPEEDLHLSVLEFFEDRLSASGLAPDIVTALPFIDCGALWDYRINKFVGWVTKKCGSSSCRHVMSHDLSLHIDFVAGTIIIGPSPTPSPLPPSGIPAETTTPEWARSESAALISKSVSTRLISFNLPPGAVEECTRIAAPFTWDRKLGAPYIFDVHVKQRDGHRVSAQVWRYQLHLDESDLLDDDPFPSPKVTRHGREYRTARSTVEIMERFTINPTFPYHPMTPVQPLRFLCDPRQIPSRFFLQDATAPPQAPGCMEQSRNRTRQPRALLAQYTVQCQKEHGDCWRGQDCDGEQKEGLVTTIMEHPLHDAIVSGYCTFSGRIIYSRVKGFVLRYEDGGQYDELEDVILYDFLN